MCPAGELSRHSPNKVLKLRKVLVVGTQAAGEFPDSFNRVQIWAVRWQEEEDQRVLVAAEPVAEKSRVVISRVVKDEHEFSTPPLVTDHHLEKVEERLCVEDRSLTGHHEAVRRPHRPNEREALPGRGMKDDGVFLFRRNPHRAP